MRVLAATVLAALLCMAVAAERYDDLSQADLALKQNLDVLEEESDDDLGIDGEPTTQAEPGASWPLDSEPDVEDHLEDIATPAALLEEDVHVDADPNYVDATYPAKTSGNPTTARVGKNKVVLNIKSKVLQTVGKKFRVKWDPKLQLDKGRKK
mmetsp:Transcript_7917/g.17366  ORF Transcript_7917/g.17366 Transcript_7917/m.17366 type:complete len:153 (-) Transcript_7917:45-503(-)